MRLQANNGWNRVKDRFRDKHKTMVTTQAKNMSDYVNNGNSIIFRFFCKKFQFAKKMSDYVNNGISIIFRFFVRNFSLYSKVNTDK